METEEKNPVEERIINLNKRTKEAEEAKVQAETKAKEAEVQLAKLEKDNQFLNQFTEVSTKFPNATEFKDKIREKVMSGYSAEDATIAVLHSEGKLGSPKIENVSGGSAPNQLVIPPEKTLNEMSSAERWAALKEMESKGELFKK